MEIKKMVEKLVEKEIPGSALTIVAGTQKSPKPVDNQGFWTLVPVAGLEPARCRQRWILSPLRLPFHHTGRCLNSILHYFQNSKQNFPSEQNNYSAAQCTAE